MSPEKHNIPTFSSPPPGSLFLASKHGLRTYEDLEKYRLYFLQLLHDFEADYSRPVAFLADSCDELIFAIASCWKSGIPFCCLNPDASSAELDQQIKILNPDLIFADDDCQQLISSDQVLNIRQLNIEKGIHSDLEPSHQVSSFNPRLNPDDIFGYFFTSGTTGKPKVVPLKRRQMLFAAHSSGKNFRPRVNHFWLLCLPLNHIGGVSIVLRSILYGSGIYRMNRFDRDMVATFLSENTLFQAASMVPTMLKRLVEIKAFRIHKNFRAILLGGGPIDPELIQRSVAKGIPLVPSYGMTETCAQIAANPILKPSGLYPPLKSAGTVFEPNEIEIRDDQGERLNYNNSGSIWLRGPQVFDGYLNEGPGSPDIDDEGWFNTGDYGHLNANGQLFVESRRSDLIITGGENVSPFEVESELEKINPISEAAVLGIPDKEWGEKVVAVVVVRTESKDINTEKIRKHLKERITSYKIPKQITLTDSLPRTNNGNIQREELLKMFE